MTSAPLAITFPTPRGVSSQLSVPPAPVSQVTDLVRTGVNEDTRLKLVCKDQLSPAQLEQARIIAKQEYPIMIGPIGGTPNTEEFMSFGLDALKEMNDLVEDLLREVKPVEIPELTKLMSRLADEMRQVRGDYDVSDPKIRERLDRIAQGVQEGIRIWGRAKTFLEMLSEDIISMEQKFDRITAALAGKTAQMTANVSHYDRLYAANERSILALLGRIAIMELIVEEADADARTLVPSPEGLSERQVIERKRVIADFINNMEMKITEFKSRFYIGGANASQITTMRTLDVSLAARLDTMVNITVPTMKWTLLQWRTMILSMQAAALTNVVANSAQEVFTSFSAAAAVAIPQIADQVATPTVSPEAITQMANDVATEANGVIAAIHKGKDRRAKVDDAIVRSLRVIKNSNERVTDAVIDALIGEANEPLPPELALPTAA